MKEKNYKIKVSFLYSITTLATVYGTTPKNALRAARRLYPNDYDYYLWSLQDNGEWAYDRKIYKTEIL